MQFLDGTGGADLTMETPKRLEPTKATAVRLFALSGNQCAFEGCDHPLMDADRNFVAQICHIRDAMPGGRFCDCMTNEKRRAFENLLIMCHRHHKITDDVVRFPLGQMQRIKRQHEAQFSESTGNHFRAPDEVIEALCAFPPLPILSERLHLEVQRYGRAWMNYRASDDVRRPDWPLGKTQVFISGASGVGKSWYLAALADRVSESGAVVTLHSMEGHQQASDILRDCAEVIANVAADSTVGRPLPAVDKLLAHRAGGRVQRYLFVDAVADTMTAQRLLVDNRGHIAIVVTEEVARDLRPQENVPSSNQWHEIPLADFSPEERNDLLEKADVEPSSLSSQLLQLLRRPFHARTFVQRTAIFGRPTAQTAYELLSEYWRVDEGISWDGTLERLSDLCLSVLLETGEYPFKRRKAETSLGEASFDRLVARGYIVRRSSSEVALTHDLNLSWLAARALVQQPISEEGAHLLSVAGCRSQKYGEAHAKLVGRMSSLASDTIAASLAFESQERLVEVISALLRDRQRIGQEAVRSYGAMVLPAYRLYAERCDKGEIRFRDIGNKHLADSDSVIWAIDALISASESIVRFATQLLSRSDTSNLLAQDSANRAALYLAALLDRTPDVDRSKRNLTWSALRNVIAGRPATLTSSLESEVLTRRRVLELARSLRCSAGRSVWQSVKASLTPADDYERRCFGRAVIALLDEAELPKMRRWLAEELRDIFDAEVFAGACIALGDEPVATLEKVPTKLLRNLTDSIKFSLVQAPQEAEAILCRRLSDADADIVDLGYLEPVASFLPQAFLERVLDSAAEVRTRAKRLFERAHSPAALAAMKARSGLFDEPPDAEYGPFWGANLPIGLRAAAEGEECGARIVRAALGHKNSALTCLYSDLGGIFLTAADAPLVGKHVPDESGQRLASNLIFMGCPELALDVALRCEVQGFEDDATAYLATMSPTNCDAVRRAREIIRASIPDDESRALWASLIVVGLSGQIESIDMLLTKRFTAASTRNVHLHAVRLLATGSARQRACRHLRERFDDHPSIVVDALWEEHSEQSLTWLADRFGLACRPTNGSLTDATWLRALSEQVNKAKTDYDGFLRRSYPLVPADEPALRLALRRATLSSGTSARSLARYLRRTNRNAAFDEVEARRCEPAFCQWAIPFLIEADWQRGLAIFVAEGVSLDEDELRQLGVALDKVESRDELSHSVAAAWASESSSRSRLLALLGWQSDDVGAGLVNEALSDFQHRSVAMDALMRRASVKIALELLGHLTGEDAAHDWGYVDAFTKLCNPGFDRAYLDGEHLLRRTQTTLHPALRNTMRKGLKPRYPRL